MNCPYARCSCTKKTCKGKRQGKPQKPWGKFCCSACGNKARMARYYERTTKEASR